MKQTEDIFSRVVENLSSNNKSQAAKILNTEYPFSEKQQFKRKYTFSQRLEIFIRDGFIDRYTGKRLIYPSVLYAISNELPDEFPMKGARHNSHPAHWDLFPTIDHLIPVSQGGEDIPENWITTSMTINLRKSSTTIEELGWELYPPGKIEEWDGLCSWYMSYMQNRAYLSSLMHNKGWHKAVCKRF